MKKVILSLAVSLVGSAAVADQCAIVTEAQARKAIDFIEAGAKVQSLCEPCGETAPQTIKTPIAKLDTVGGQESARFAVLMNGKMIDLAYTYVNGLNLSKIVDCPSQQVSLILAK